MPGVFNTVDHETETHSRDTAGMLMDGISEIFAMLGDVERGNIAGADSRRQNIAGILDQTRQMLEQLSQMAGSYPLRWPSPGDPTGPELTRLYTQFEEMGYPMPMKNNDLGKIGAYEVNALAGRISLAKFSGSSEDWFPIREIISAVERLLSIGILAARISALHGHQYLNM
jgi:hypothetical protein